MDYATLKRFFPNASLSTLLRNAGDSTLHAPKPERDSGLPLVPVAQGKGKGRPGPQARYRITFTVFRLRPLDFDNHFCKPLQDALVRAGLLPDDNWKVLEGGYRSAKAGCESEERTEVLIERIA